MTKWINLLIGGTAGTVLRYWITAAVHQWTGPEFPYGTLTVNTIGCFLAGIFYSLAEAKLAASQEARLLFLVGFCGAFTTFSSLILESTHLAKNGELVKALLNIAFNLFAGFFVFLAAYSLTQFALTALSVPEKAQS